MELTDLSCEEPVDAAGFLAAQSGLSKSRIKDAMTKGAVWIQNGQSRPRRLRRAKHQLTPAERISFYHDEAILAIEPPELRCLEATRLWSVWIKPTGVVCSGSRFGDHCAVNRIVERKLDKPTFLVHRLDQFVTGVMLVAHAKKTAAALSKQFETRQTLKIYRAVVHGRFSGEITIDEPVEEKSARSVVRGLEADDEYSTVEIDIETGRKHQIRRHLQHIGHPVVGDRQYGSESQANLKLAAIRLGFTDPASGEWKTFELPEGDYPAK